MAVTSSVNLSPAPCPLSPRSMGKRRGGNPPHWPGLLLHQAFSVFSLISSVTFVRQPVPVPSFWGNTPTGGNPSEQPGVAAAPGLLGVPIRSQGESADAAEGGLEAHVRGLLDQHLLQVRPLPKKRRKKSGAPSVLSPPAVCLLVSLRRIKTMSRQNKLNETIM